MKSIQLTEFKSCCDIELSQDELADVRPFTKIVHIERQVASDQYSLTPSHYIGVIRSPRLTIHIRPKVEISSVLFLVSHAIEEVRFGIDQAEFQQNDNVVSLLGRMLASLVYRAIGKGLVHGYQSRDEAQGVLRGQLLVPEQIRRYFGRMPPVEVRHDVFTADVIENRLLLAAIRAIKLIPELDPQVESELTRVQRSFGEVTEVRFQTDAVPRIVFTRINGHYRSAIGLATLILQSTSIDVGEGARSGSAFLVDMNAVFERFVRTTMRNECGFDKTAFPNSGGNLSLDEGGKIRLKPDLRYLDRRGRVVWVGDVKYKGLSDPERSPKLAHQSDIYQILAYVTALGLNSGTLIYASSEDIPARAYTVRTARAILKVFTLNLSQSPQRLLSAINEIGKSIPSSSADCSIF